MMGVPNLKTALQEIKKPELKYHFIALPINSPLADVVLIERHPRKELMQYYGAKHAKKMYTTIGGRDFHTGYVVSGVWYTILAAEPFRPDPI